MPAVIALDQSQLVNMTGGTNQRLEAAKACDWHQMPYFITTDLDHPLYQWIMALQLL